MKSRPIQDPVSLPDSGLSRTRKARNISLTLLAAAAVFIALKGSAVEKIPRICPWYSLTGTDCPFCGLIRSLAALGDGNLSQAVKFHPFGPLAAAAGLVLLAGALHRWITGRELDGLYLLEKHAGKIAMLIGFSWLLWWLLGIL